MYLSQQEIELFYKIWYGLVYGINAKYKITPPFKKPKYGERVNEEPFVAIREQLWENPQWIADFVKDNSDKGLSQEEQDILLSWSKYFIHDKFIAVKQSKKYAVLMSTSDDPKLYAVVGISQPVESVVRHTFPVLVETILLPFKNKIIYDSFIGTFGIHMGPGMRKYLKGNYNSMKKTTGIIEMLQQNPLTYIPRAAESN